MTDVTSPDRTSQLHTPAADIAADLAHLTAVGLLHQWRPDDTTGGYIVTTGNAVVPLRDPAHARAFIAGLRAVFHSPRRTTFFELVAAADAMQTEAQRLCDEANESGQENDEFAVREAADELRARALGVAEVILDRPAPRTGSDSATDRSRLMSGARAGRD
ncbi:hypothetical protein [Actinoplanes sp. NPDC049316]|uniref:hypothetical protein n=1 Tax=Actinoplanes sp. NPDC049316 TaxID=3154727 RepID=UPI003427F1AE